MNELEMKHQFEAALLAGGRPLTTQQLAELFDERERPSMEQVLNALNGLREDYQGRGIELLEVSSGWRIQIRTSCIDFVSRLWQERPAKYSRALLETLALIAYRQPITRGEIEEIRGVAVSSSIMRTMHDRNWIRVVGHREVPGRPELLATNKDFLDYFGLKSLDELPTLAELKDVETIGVQLEFSTDDSGQVATATTVGIEADTEVAAPISSDELNAEVAEVQADSTEAELPEELEPEAETDLQVQ
ncbi:MAG: SMC-Scp complex subunit ScpB [Steroidobacteraceae bacterium]